MGQKAAARRKPSGRQTRDWGSREADPKADSQSREGSYCKTLAAAAAAAVAAGKSSILNQLSSFESRAKFIAKPKRRAKRDLEVCEAAIRGGELKGT